VSRCSTRTVCVTGSTAIDADGNLDAGSALCVWGMKVPRSSGASTAVCLRTSSARYQAPAARSVRRCRRTFVEWRDRQLVDGPRRRSIDHPCPGTRRNCATGEKVCFTSLIRRPCLCAPCFDIAMASLVDCEGEDPITTGANDSVIDERRISLVTGRPFALMKRNE